MPPDDFIATRASERAVHLMQTELEARRETISRELCTIPPPVPACDVNFNRLLEERANVIDQLQRLRRLLDSGAPVEGLRLLVQQASALSPSTKRQVEQLLATAP